MSQILRQSRFLGQLIIFELLFLGFNMTFYQRDIMGALSVLYMALFILALSVNANESSMHIGNDEALSISTNENSIHINTDQETKIR